MGPTKTHKIRKGTEQQQSIHIYNNTYSERHKGMYQKKF